MRSLLVTGGAGFIGGNFVHHWIRAHPEDRLVVLDALTYAGNLDTLRPISESKAGERMTFVHGDICDAELVERIFVERAVDTVVHFAAESHVDRSIVDPGEFVRTNVTGTHVLLDAARRTWSSGGEWRRGTRFHHVSTDEVYGSLGPDDPPFTESTPYRPNSPYAASKAAADHLVRAYRHTYGLPTTISNCSNNYGPFQFPEKLIPLIIVNTLHGRALPVYGDGLQVRDWLYVEDHCVAIDRMLSADVEGATFNVGGRAERTNLDLVRSVCEIVDERFRRIPELRERFSDSPAASGVSCSELIEHVRDRAGHDRRYAIDASRIAEELGFEPSETLDTGLARTVDWYLTHEDWWRGVMDGRYRRWIATQYGTQTPTRVG